MSKLLQAMDDIQDRMQSIADFRECVAICLSPDRLISHFKGTQNVALGIVYEGMRSAPEGGAGQQGLANVAVFGLYLKIDTAFTSKSYDKTKAAIELLDQMRAKLFGTRASPGHKFKFLMEALVDDSTANIWVQRWQTPVLYPVS